MRSFFPLIFGTVVITVFGIIQLLFFRFFNKVWWRKKWVRIICWSLPLGGLVGIVLWWVGEYNINDLIAYPGAIISVIVFIFEFCLVLSLPFSGILNFIDKLIDKYKPVENESPASAKRRKLLKTAAASIPLLALTAGASGVIRAEAGANVYRRKMKIKNLPGDLEGFRIFHLSDIHLRHYVTLDDLETMVHQAAAFSPDLTLVTGDIADDLKLLPDALKIIDGMKSPYGSYACLGNHEYFRGIQAVRSIFDKSTIPLFVNDGSGIQVENTSFFIGGIDDPRHMGAKQTAFFQAAIDEMNRIRSEDSFTVLMSHRPDALDYASETGINLVLSGHTHGGQIGFNGRSIFEREFPDRYLWGEYHREKTSLYTSAGAGHWFPFRLGCPPEAPIIELTKA